MELSSHDRDLAEALKNLRCQASDKAQNNASWLGLIR